MPTLAVTAQLDLVDRDKIHLALGGHGLDRANPVARPRWNALFFPGHQSHRALADSRGHPVVHLARQQAKGQPDHPALVLQHALDSAVGLPGVGGTQLGEDGLRTTGAA